MAKAQDERGDLVLGVLFPDRYMKAADLGDKRPNVVIDSLGIESVPLTGGKKERALVCSLRRPNGEKIPKQLIVNKTNAYAVALLLVADLGARNLRDSIGKRITLCADVDTLGKTDVPCIRIAGSPDAPADRAAAYAAAWRGARKGGALIGRLKRSIGMIAMGKPPPVEVDAPEPVHDEPPTGTGDLFGDDDERTGT